MSHLPGQRPESRDHLQAGGEGRGYLGGGGGGGGGTQGAAPLHTQVQVWVQNGTGMAAGVRTGDPSGSTPRGSHSLRVPEADGEENRAPATNRKYGCVCSCCSK